MAKTRFISILRDAIRLDIYDLNFSFSSDAMVDISISSYKTSRVRGKHMLIRLSALFRIALVRLCNLRPGRKEPMQLNPILFFACSKNQKDALLPIKGKIGNSRFLGMDLDDIEPFPVFEAILFSLPFLPLLLVRFLGDRSHNRHSFRWALHFYLFSYGFYVLSRLLMRRMSPSAVVVANDHSMHLRAFVKAARDAGIPSIYTQHACITWNFPALSFDYALLDGKDALMKYDSAGPSTTKIYLIGIPKYDAYFKLLNTHKTVMSIGLCIGTLESPSRVEQLLEHLRKTYSDLQLVLRPHPGDTRVALWTNLSEKYGVDFSNSKSEGAFDLLARVDVVISGDSSILLEAALMDVYPVYYDFTLDSLDFYGFLRNGLVEYASEPEEVCSILERLSKSKPSVRSRTKLYCASVGTRFEGHSSELAAKIIGDMASCASVDTKLWTKIAGLKHLEAYEFASV